MAPRLFTLCLMLTGLSTLATWKNAGAYNVVNRQNRIRPVIFVPGDGGSLLEAKVTAPSSKTDDCPLEPDWYRIWLNINKLLPYNLDCFGKHLLLNFDPKTNKSSFPPGVQVRVPNFGMTKSMEYIDPSWEAYLLDNAGAYGEALAKRLLSLGYTRDESIRGAPFDFRFAMSSDPNNYFANLTTLVEDTFLKNFNSKVVLVSHSLGGIFTTWFLNHQPQSWKDIYIDSFISLSTPWAGSSHALIALTAGFNFGIPVIEGIRVRREQRSFETNYLLLPRAEAFSPGKIFVHTDRRNYTASPQDIEALFRDMNFAQGVDIYRYVRGANLPAKILPPHPGVKTYCVYGTEIDTEEQLHFEGKNFPDEKPKLNKVNGDGTAAYESLSACNGWLGSVQVIELPGINHQGALKSKKGIQTVVDILFRET